MVFDHIEKVKQEYTDKYVAVQGDRPELARFKGEVGQVKTVNMSGRALVEFIDYHLNIGWYDIDLDYLKVVDKPEPKAKEEKKPAKKPAAKKAPASDAGGKKLSPLEMARAQGAAKKKDAPAKPSGGKPSTADILASLRGGAKAEPAAALEDAPDEDPPGQTTEESIAVEEAPAEAPAAGSSDKVDRASMSPEDMIAWCKEHDAG